MCGILMMLLLAAMPLGCAGWLRLPESDNVLFAAMPPRGSASILYGNDRCVITVRYNNPAKPVEAEPRGGGAAKNGEPKVRKGRAIPHI